MKQEPDESRRTLASAPAKKPVEIKARPASRRVYFQFVCSTVDGYPDVDHDNGHVGYFDYDEAGLSAKGLYYFPLWYGKDKPQSISIFKISEKPDSNAEPKNCGNRRCTQHASLP